MKTNQHDLKLITRTVCRVCQSDQLTPIYSLGTQYVSNFINPQELEKCIKAPLDMIFCENCTLLQLKHTILFSLAV